MRQKNASIVCSSIILPSTRKTIVQQSIKEYCHMLNALNEPFEAFSISHSLLIYLSFLISRLKEKCAKCACVCVFVCMFCYCQLLTTSCFWSFCTHTLPIVRLSECYSITFIINNQLMATKADGETTFTIHLNLLPSNQDE